ncbi:MAG TPA: hypothetical protein VEG62_01650 [Acidimicrobiales bacterium]|nr:hypothetical protein [Acidimicrobiales bacterium]HXZ61416.1 hypothetical protein [Acidimicrobiales bacterium]
MEPTILESCHSTWVFDAQRMEFCRILRDVKVGGRCVTTQWRPYFELVEDAATFTVHLDPSGVRQLTSHRHTKHCDWCGNEAAVA